MPKLGNEAARWSGQVMDTIDYCGFIGVNPGNKRVLVATGDSGQGMTHGALAGILLKNLVIYGAGEWSDVYDPSRKPLSAVMNFISENVTAIKNFAEYLMPAEIDSADELKPGQGGIMRDGLQKIAVSRDRTASFTSARRCARISAATCTGTRPSNAGIVPATDRISVRKARCWPDQPLRRWRSGRCPRSQKRPRRRKSSLATLPSGRSRYLCIERRCVFTV